MRRAMRRTVLPCLMDDCSRTGTGTFPQAAHAAGYNPVTQQAQSKLASILVTTPGLWTGSAAA